MPYPTNREQVVAQMRTAPEAFGQEQVRTEMLTNEDEQEVLAFLSERPLHTVVMAGFINDNGLENPFNRGTFYAARTPGGQLDGVALIGHATLLETRSHASIRAFAHLTQSHPDAYMIMGEQEKVETFWNYYAAAGQPPRLFCRELLFEKRWPVAAAESIEKLRCATLDDLNLVMPVHAEIALRDSGVNPLEADPAGFRLRTARRIEQGRVYLLVEDERVIFKADVISETEEVIYLEGIYVSPSERRRGLGLRCLSQLERLLLARTKSLCVLVNEQHKDSLSFFQRAGFKLRSCYDTIFLHQGRPKVESIRPLGGLRGEVGF